MAFDKEHFAAVLQQLREQHNETQAAASQRVGVTEKTYGEWLHCKSAPRAYNITAISVAYGIPVGDLLGDNGETVDTLEVLLAEIEWSNRALGHIMRHLGLNPDFAETDEN